jgi:hypothetical protein
VYSNMPPALDLHRSLSMSIHSASNSKDPSPLVRSSSGSLRSPDRNRSPVVRSSSLNMTQTSQSSEAELRNPLHSTRR